MTGRRDVLRMLAAGVGAVGAVAVAPGASVAVAVTQREPLPDLPPVHGGDVLTAATWNALVDRVNVLTERAR